ncbi:hypothetical protein FB451DRAFT_1405876 [Mycena latifolia]|nr:hypothetical protein FB451DRAFT_1405876 [Mycena latifolia]
MSADAPRTPLQNTTNTPAAPLATAPATAELEAEISRLKGLVAGFTKKRGRGRKRVRDESTPDDDNEDTPTPSKKAKGSDALDYVGYGRVIAWFLGPFVDISEVIQYGTKRDTDMSGDEREPDARLAEEYKILWEKFPGFHTFLLSITNQPVVRRAIERQLTAGMEGVRSEDTSTLKSRIVLWLYKEPTTPLDPPLSSLKLKAVRGMAHPVFARLLTPMEWAATQETWLEIVGGTKHLKGTQLPAFIFPFGQVFPVGTALDNPVWLGVLDNALKGEILLRSAKALLMGPEAALEGDGYHKGRPGNASVITMTTFSRRICAWVVVQVYFSLSSKQEWHRRDGDHFDYEELFWTIYGLFDNEKWGKEIIALWNKVVLGKAAGNAPANASSASGPSALEQIKAARAAAEAAAADVAAAAAAGENGAGAPAAVPGAVPDPAGDRTVPASV